MVERAPWDTIGANTRKRICTHAHTDRALFRRRIVRPRNAVQNDARRISTPGGTAKIKLCRTPRSFPSAQSRLEADPGVRCVQDHVSAWSQIRSQTFGAKIFPFNQQVASIKTRMTGMRHTPTTVQN
jgi:hypothetical protein